MGREEARHSLDSPGRRLIQRVRREDRDGLVHRQHERQGHVERPEQPQPQDDGSRDLRARTAHLTVPHHGVEIAQGQMSSGDQDGQQDGRPRFDEPTVHVPAVGAGLAGSNRLAARRRADAPDHRSNREPHRAAERDRVPFDRQDAALPRLDPAPQHPAILEGHGPRLWRHRDLPHLDQQGVTRLRSDDVDGARHRHSGRVLERLVESLGCRADVSRDGTVRATVEIHRDIAARPDAGRSRKHCVVVPRPVPQPHVDSLCWSTPRRHASASRTFHSTLPPTIVSIDP